MSEQRGRVRSEPSRKRVEAEATGPLLSAQSHRVSLPQALDGRDGCLVAGQEFQLPKPKQWR
jgi:hypothetical protein